MHIGQDQQQDPTDHSGGVRRVPFYPPSAHLQLTFCSPSAPLRNFKTCKLNSETETFSRFQPLPAVLEQFQQLSNFLKTVFNYFQRFKQFKNTDIQIY